MKLDIDKVVSLFIIVFLALPNLAVGKSFSSLNNKGNRFYLKGKYQKALELYKKAESENPNSPIVSYNLGNVGHQQQDFQEAQLYYQRALGNQDRKQLADTYYNLGNNYFRQGRIEESLAAYQSCLELNPNDLDAKYNIEFIKRMKQHNQKSQQQDNKQEKQKEDGKSGQQNQSKQNDKRKENERKQEPKRESDQQGKKEKEGQQQEQRQQNQQEESVGAGPKMSREEAERILNAVKDQERELLKKQERFGQERRVRKGRDW